MTPLCQQTIAPHLEKQSSQKLAKIEDMLFYSTLKSYAEPWIDMVGSALTESARNEHHALIQRLDALEKVLTCDFSVANVTLKHLEERLRTLETTSSSSENELLQQGVLRIAERQANFANEISNLQNRLTKIEDDETGRPCFEDHILHRVKTVTEQQATSTNEISNLQQCIVQLEDKVQLEQLEQRLQILEAKSKINDDNNTMNDNANEQTPDSSSIFQMQQHILKLVERGGDFDARVTALEGDLKNQRLERENSKLKRKSFLSLPMKNT